MKHITIAAKAWMLVCAVVLTQLLSACKDDPPLPDNFVTFESSELGIAESESSLPVNITLTRAANTDITVTVSLTATGISYGTGFTTTPAATSDNISVVIPKGSAQGSFTISKVAGLLLDGGEKITFAIADVTKPIIIGDQSQLVVTFSEILSTGATMDINGGGATFGNKVFVDLSANRQSAVTRTAWDLGFYAGDDFRVIVNSSTAMMARAIDKNDLNAVTAKDTTGFASEMSLMAFNPDAMAWIDDPSGDLTKTAIASVSATASENKVYIINRGSGVGSPAPARGWKKIRVIRNGNGYTLQHADIGATTFSEITITKDTNYEFQYVQFEGGAAAVEPAKDKWDIAWTYFTNTTANGSVLIPYGFQDIILQNRNVQTAKVLTSAVTYANFSESNLSGLTFSSSQLGIGADWRRTSPSPAIVYDDRFYVIKDSDNNYYKLRFTALVKDGVRGTPQIEFALVKKGS